MRDPLTSRSVDGLTVVSIRAETKFNSVIHRLAQLLLASNVPFGRLHGGMA